MQVRKYCYLKRSRQWNYFTSLGQIISSRSSEATKNWFRRTVVSILWKKKLSFKLNFAVMKVWLNFAWLIRLGTKEYSFRVVLRQSAITTDPIYLFLILIMHTKHTKTWNKNHFFLLRLCNYIDYIPIYQSELIFLLKKQKHKSIRFSDSQIFV